MKTRVLETALPASLSFIISSYVNGSSFKYFKAKVRLPSNISIAECIVQVCKKGGSDVKAFPRADTRGRAVPITARAN